MTDEDVRKLSELKKHFRPEDVSWLIKSTTPDKLKGMAIAYIDSRDVQDRLDDIVGPENWRDSYQMVGGTMMCCIEIRIGDEWIAKHDGAGATDVEAEKGQISDAFKRAAVKWGIGRYLYAMPSPWVEIVGPEKRKRVADHEMPKLLDMLRRQGAAVSTPPPPQPRAEQPAPEQQQNPSQARKSGDYERIQAELRKCTDVGDLAEAWMHARDAISRMPDSWKQLITEEKDRCKAKLMQAPQLQAAE